MELKGLTSSSSRLAQCGRRASRSPEGMMIVLLFENMLDKRHVITQDA